MNDQVSVFFDQMMRSAASFTPRLVVALIILIVGFWFAGWTARAFRRMADKHTLVQPSLLGILTSTIRYGILVVVCFAVMGQLGIATTSILAVFGAAGLAIGLALQGTLQNVAAGIMLITLRPFRVGDVIDTGSINGTVKEIGLFACELHTFDGLYIFAPNSELWNKKLTNFSRLPTRQINLTFSIGYDDDPGTARDILLAMAKADDRVLKDSDQLVFITSLGDSAVNVCLRVWVARPDFHVVTRDFLERGKRALEDGGLSIPFPQRDVHLINAQHGISSVQADKT